MSSFFVPAPTRSAARPDDSRIVWPAASQPERPVLLKVNPGQAPWFSPASLLLCVVISACFILIRLWHLTGFDLWYDELFSLGIARQDWSGLMAGVIQDAVHPPLFYIVLKLWISLGGDSLYWLRLLPAVTASAGIVPLILLCRGLNFRAAETNLVLVLVAGSGFLIDWAQQIRMYSQLLLFTVCSLWAFVQLVNAAAVSKKVTFQLVLLNLLLLYTHYFGWLVIVLELLWLGVFRRDKIRSFVLRISIPVLAFLPWATVALISLKRVESLNSRVGWIEQPTLSTLVGFYTTLNGDLQFPRSTFVQAILFGLPVVICLYFALRTARHGGNRSLWSTLCWLALLSTVPTVSAFVLSRFLPVSVWNEQYLIIVAVPYLLLVAISVNRLGLRWLSAAGALLVGAWVVSGGITEVNTPNRFIGWQSLVTQMTDADPTNSTDVPVYTFEDFVGVPLSFYLGAGRDQHFRVATADSMASVNGDHFWVVLRDIRWTEQLPPEAILESRGYRVGARVVSADRSQHVIALPAWRQPRASASLGNVPALAQAPASNALDDFQREGET